MSYHSKQRERLRHLHPKDEEEKQHQHKEEEVGRKRSKLNNVGEVKLRLLQKGFLKLVLGLWLRVKGLRGGSTLQ